MTQWIDACATDDIDEEDLIRFDHGGATYAIYHGVDGKFYATAGMCTHEHVHLCDGLVMDFMIVLLLGNDPSMGTHDKVDCSLLHAIEMTI